MDRWTKAAALISVLAAVVYETATAARDLPWLPWLALVSAVAAYVAGRVLRERAAGAVMAIGYLVPALFMLGHGHFRLHYLTPWVATLVGVTAATTNARWNYPLRFKLPLVLWALTIATTWPLIALRVIDWTPSLWSVPPSTPNSAVHSVPMTVWIAQTAQVHLLGLLWLDWLCGRFTPETVGRFVRFVIRPLLLSAAVAGLLAAYQGFFDLHFLSIGDWAEIGRASGALADGNASGALSALWVAVPLALAASASTRGAKALLILVSAISVLAVWGSGSRTSLLCAAVGLSGALFLPGRRFRSPAFVAALVVAVATVAVGWSAPAVGPLSRVRELLPDLSPASIGVAVRELWVRNGYGLIAVEMVKDAPMQGVGVGAFHGLSDAYAIRAIGRTIPPDNAQNWPRHLVAELGVLGSIGWAWWVVLAAVALVAGRAAPAGRAQLSAVKFTLAGFAAASMLGLPGQNLLVTLTFWTFACWLLLLVVPVEHWVARADPGGRRWGMILALVLAFSALTLRAGWGDLRPPFRAKRLDHPFRYGFYDSFDAPSGRTRTSEHAVWVPQAPRRWLKLRVWVEHPDADAQPVMVQVWRDHERIIARRFPRTVPLTRYIDVGGSNQRFVIETTVDRTYLPADRSHGPVGLSLEWEYVDQPPPGAF